MKTLFTVVAGCVVFCAVLSTAAGSEPFTYQGCLNDRGLAAQGRFDLCFALFDAPTAGAQIGSAQTNLGVALNNGLFTVELDFGTNAFDGSARWLEISLRATGQGGGFTVLIPRQCVGAAPYALHSLTAATLSAPLASSLLPGNVACLNADQTFQGNVHFGATGAVPFSVSSTGLVANLNADLLGGLRSTDFARSGHTHDTSNIFHLAPGGSDTNPGTLDRPFASLGGAISRVPDHSVLILAPGEYPVTPVHVTDYFDSQAPIRIVGRTNLTIQGHGATLNGGTNRGRFVYLAQSRGITFAGLCFINDVHNPVPAGALLYSTVEMCGTNSQVRFVDCGFDKFGNHAISQLYGVDGTKASDGVWVERCWFANGGSDAAQDGTAISGLGRNWFVRACLFTNCLRDVEMEGPTYHPDGGQVHVEGCTSVSNRDISIMLFCTSGNMANHPNLHIANNIIRGAFNGGVVLRGGRNIQIANNTVEMAGPASIGIALVDECGVDGALIQNNLVRGAGWRGIQAWGLRMTNVVIANNLVREGGGYAIWAAAERLRIAGNSLETGWGIKWGIRVDGSPGAAIENNIIYASTSDAFGIHLGGSATNVSLFNNQLIGGQSLLLAEGHVKSFLGSNQLGTPTNGWTVYGMDSVFTGSNYIETLTVGTLNDTNGGILPTHAARLDADQTFAGANRFSAPSNSFGGDVRMDGTISSGQPSAFLINTMSAQAVDPGVFVRLRVGHYGGVTIQSADGGTYRVVVPIDVPLQMYGRKPTSWSVTTHLSDCTTVNYVTRTRVYNSAVDGGSGTYTEDITDRNASGLQTYTVAGPASFDETSRSKAVEYQVTLAPNGFLYLGSVVVSYTY